MRMKSILLSAAFLGASVLGASAQSTPSPSAADNISAATHCKDKVTGQAKLKSAAAIPGSKSTNGTTGTTGSAAANTGSSSPSGSAASGSVTDSMAWGSAGASTSVNLPDCP